MKVKLYSPALEAVMDRAPSKSQALVYDRCPEALSL